MTNALNDQVQQLNQQIETLRKESEIRVSQIQESKDTEMNEVVEEYTQRENQFKSKTEEIVKKLKDKIKKEKKASERALAEV